MKIFVFQSIDCIKPSTRNLSYLDIHSLGIAMIECLSFRILDNDFLYNYRSLLTDVKKVCLHNNRYFRLLQFGSYWASSTMYPNKMFRLNFHCFQLKIIGFTTSYLGDIQYCLVGFLLNKWFSSLFFLASENRIDKQNNQISCWENAF